MAMTTLKDLRLQAGLSVQEVSTKADIALRSIYRYERENRCPASIHAAKLAKLYNVPADVILSLFADKPAALPGTELPKGAA
jgi:transcriptional regulator with XRE-family HTH domain